MQNSYVGCCMGIFYRWLSLENVITIQIDHIVIKVSQNEKIGFDNKIKGGKIYWYD